MKGVVFLCAILVAAVLADDFKCKVGVGYKENNCNGCHCDVHGLACTLMACQSHQDEKLTKCEKGTTWNEGCEQCWCTNLGTVCTVDCGKVHEIPQH